MRSYEKWNEYYLTAFALKEEILKDIEFLNHWMRNHESTLSSIEDNLDVEMKLMLEYMEKADQESANKEHPLSRNPDWLKAMEIYRNHRRSSKQLEEEK